MLAALLSATFALVVLSGGPRKAPNQFLAFFMLLIAGNQAFEVLRALASPMPAADLWFRLASVCAALDPFVLYYFASIYPSRNALNATRRVAAVFAGSLALVATVPFGSALQPYSGLAPGISLVLTLFTGTVYLAVLRHWLRGFLADPNDPTFRWLLPAIVMAALPYGLYMPGAAIDSAFVSAFPAEAVSGAPFGSTSLQFLESLALPAMAAGLLVTAFLIQRASARSEASTRRLVDRSIAAGIALSVMLGTANIVARLTLGGWVSGRDVVVLLGPIGQAGAPIRWLLFGSFVSVALLRHDMLGMSLPARRRAARALVALAMAAVVGGLVLAAQALAGSALALTPTEIGLLAVAVLASQGFRGLADRVAERVYGVPMPGDLAAAIHVFRAAAAQSAARGRSPLADPEIERLRGDLGIDEREAEVLVRMAAPGRDGPLSEGALVEGRYRLQRLIGRGGSGRAFLARDELLQREVVLKEVPHPVAQGGRAALEEAVAAGKLQHPNVVTVHDVLRQPGATLIVTEYVAGGSLAERLDHGPLPLDGALRVVEGTLAGLAAVHARGVVHRDLKPANILLAEDGTPKIADFGIARIRRGVTAGFGEADGSLRGTPEFMAPEQRAGALATERTDLWAAGLLLRRCAPEPIPAAIASVADRALAADPQARWPSAAAMLEALRAARAVAGGDAAPAGAPAGTAPAAT